MDLQKKRRRGRGRPIRVPINQGSLSYIAYILVRPILRLRPEEWSVAAWLNYIFATDVRSIREYLVKTTFQIPGKLRDLPQRVSLEKNAGYRKIRSGSSIWVRTDLSTHVQRVEIETYNAQGKGEQLFELTLKQWKSIHPHLSPAPKRRKRSITRTGDTYSLVPIRKPNVT